MTRQDAATELPLHLCEVLEQEVAALLPEEVFPGEVEASCEERLRSVYQRIHAHPRGLAALCLSGGGMRSAVFSLGVVQGLARRRLLHGFDYLSTVSGGGYLGGLLSAWIHRHPRGLDGVSDELAGPPAGARKLEPEPAPLEHLRSFSNYLSPKLGILSADSWTLVSICLRNLYLYWFVLVPLLLAVLALPRLYVALCALRPEPWLFLGEPSWSPKPIYVLPDGLFALSGLLLTIALGYMAWSRPSGGRRSTLRGFLWVCLLPLTAGAALLGLYWAWYPDANREGTGWVWFVLPAVLMNTAAWSVNAVPAMARGRVRPLAKLRELPLLSAATVAAGLLLLAGGKVLLLQPARVAPGAATWLSYMVPWYGAFALPLFLGSFILGETLFTGLVSRWTDDDDREWWSRSAAWMLIVAVAWAAVGAVVIFGPVLLAYWRWILTPVGGLAGLATAVLAHGSLTSESQSKDRSGLIAKVLDMALALAAPVFLLVLAAVLSLGLTWLLGLPFGSKVPPLADAGALALWHIRVVAETPAVVVLVFVLLALGTGIVMALLIDINKFSLHAMYRNRLIRTFLGASRQNRRPSPFTGFDGEDDVEIWRLSQKPLHVVNVALNLVAGKRLAWQQRKAQPFTFSSLHCGSARLGYRPAELYASGGDRSRAISLGTAMAISGAAASPNMGYHSSPAITFLLTFFNARLGWWLGNPGAAGARTFGDSQPTLAVCPLISEALGLTDDRNPYVYLSDGGHFENLGLYEMVLRRCRHIVVVDAGQDPECRFEDLGNALRKIRIDLGIRIRLAKVPIWTEVPAGEHGRYCAIGKILYSEVDGPEAVDGQLLYLKPAVYGEEPPDVQHYKALNKTFPHESTGSQWFGEQQFESYRALGLHAVDTICEAAGEAAEIADLPSLFRVARRYLGETAEVTSPVELCAAPSPQRSSEAA